VPDIDIRSLSVCIQALQRALRFNDFLSQSQTVDSDDHEESSYMYEQELSRLIEIYANEERLGRVNIPLSKLLHPPFEELASKYKGGG
jgi:hypothetical protein